MHSVDNNASCCCKEGNDTISEAANHNGQIIDDKQAAKIITITMIMQLNEQRQKNMHAMQEYM